MGATFGRLVAIDVKPGSSSDSQSGLNLLKPTIYGRLAAEGCGKDVAFVTPDGFTGYWLPYDALLKAKVNVNVVFTGNQEASSAQLRVNKVAAAGVNSSVMARYGRREGFEYRALWTSDIYQDLCIMANPKVPADKVASVRAALINMTNDPEGRRILEAGAELLKSNGELGFVSADNRDYDNYRKFYRTTQVK